ncbi:MAG: alkaline phosphatase family protein, partial [Myxococcales bacterium]|nr:alkaline phosphatase family protein [Myxococcales bacterium]
SAGRALTLSLAMKDRSAVLPGGQHPDACFWLDPRAGGFTTSTYYATELPPWIATWQRAHPLAGTMHVWEPQSPSSLASLGPDDAPGEGAYGWGATFPHDPSAPASIGEPDAYLSTPASTEHLLAFAREAVRELHVGDDEEPDLLAISIATPDYIGHAFGPESWEYVDGLVRVDRAVGVFLDELERAHPG